MILVLRLNTGSVYWGQLLNLLPKTADRPVRTDFLCLRVSDNSSLITSLYSLSGGVPIIARFGDLVFGRFRSTVRILIELLNSSQRTMTIALPKSGLKALFENSIQSIELATDLTKEHKLHLYKSLLNSLNSLLNGGEV